MFEKRLKTIILELLGDFIEDFDSSELRVDSWNGQVSQTALKFKSSGLRLLSELIGLDLEILRGVIGSFQLAFDWSKLWTEPLKVSLEDVHVVCRPKAQWHSDIYISRKRNAKVRKAEELLQKQEFTNPRLTYWKKLEATIIDNLVISIRNLHIRLEDDISNPARPFAIGLTLEKVTYQSCDHNWLRTFIPLEQKRLMQKSFMMLEISQMAVYHIPKAADLFSTRIDWLQGLQYDRFVGVMTPYIAHRDYLPNISEYYILRPVNAVVRIRRSLKPEAELEIPKTSIAVLVEEIACCFEATQYQDLLMLGANISLHNTLGELGRHRPVWSSRPKSEPKRWWQYILTLVKELTHNKLSTRSPAYFHSRKLDKTEYILLHQHKLVKEFESETKKRLYGYIKIPRIDALSQSQLRSALQEIEDRHTAEEIFLFRALSESDLKVKMAAEPQKKGWFRFQLFATGKSEQEEAFENSLVEYSNLIQGSEQSTEGFIRTFLHFELKKGSISFAGRQINGLLASFLRVSLDRTVLHEQVTKDTKQIFLGLYSLKVSDPFSPCAKFSRLLVPKQMEEIIGDGASSYEVEEEIFPEENDGFPEFGIHAFKGKPVFEVRMDQSSDSVRLEVNMQPMIVIYNSICIERIKGFLKLPEALALYEIIELQTMNQLSDWREKTKAKFEYYLKNHSNFDLNLNLSAPVIIMPQNPLIEDSCQLTLDLGFCRVQSQPKMRSIQELSRLRSSSSISEDEFYEDYQVTIQDINVRLSPPGDGVAVDIIEKLDVALEVRRCALPRDPVLPTAKIHAVIANIAVRLSHLHYELIQQFLGRNGGTERSRKASIAPEDVEFRPPQLVESSEDEFFDVPDPLTELVPAPEESQWVYPYDKEHLNLTISVDHIAVILTGSEDANPLMVLRMERLKAGLAIQEATHKAACELYGVAVEDCQRENAVLLRSGFQENESIQVEYMHILPGHPERSESICDRQVTASLPTFTIAYYEEPVRLLLSLINTSPGPMSAPEPTIGISIRFEMREVDFRLNDALRTVAKLQLNSALIAIKTDPYTELEINLGQIEIEDTVAQSVCLAARNQLSFGLKVTWTAEETLIKGLVHEFSLSLLPDFVHNLAICVSDSKLYRLLRKQQKPDFPHISMSNSRPLSLDFQVIHPLLRLIKPKSRETVTIDFGRLTLEQKEKFPLSLSIQEFKVTTETLIGEEISHEPLINDCEMDLEMTSKMKISVSKLGIVGREEQVRQLVALYESYMEQYGKLKKLFWRHDAKQLAAIVEDQEGVEAGMNVLKAQMIFGGDMGEVKKQVKIHTSTIVWICSHSILTLELNELNFERSATTSRLALGDISLFLQENEHRSYFILPQDQLAEEHMLGVEVTSVSDSTAVSIHMLYPRIVLSPRSTRILSQCIMELEEVIPTAPTHPSTHPLHYIRIHSCEVCFLEDPSADEQMFFQSTSEEFESRAVIFQLSLTLEDSSALISGLNIQLTKSFHPRMSEPATRFFILHPVEIRCELGALVRMTMSEIDLDLSVLHMLYIRKLMQDFENSLIFVKKNGKQNRRLDLEIVMEKVLISISQDFNAHFIVELEEIHILNQLNKPANADLWLCAHYFNQQLLDWEPLLERVNLQVTLERFNQSQNIVRITANGEVNFNLTSALIHCLANFQRSYAVLEEYKAALGTYIATQLKLLKSGSGYHIVNESGQSLKFWIGSKQFLLQQNEERSLDFEEISSEFESPLLRFKHGIKQSRESLLKTISLQVGQLPRIHDISVERVGCKVHDIPQMGSHIQILCDVIPRRGDKVLVIRSPFQVRNDLRFPIELRIVLPIAQGRYEEFYVSIPVPPTESTPIPITNSYFTEFQVRMQGYGWSNRVEIGKLEESVVIECPNKSISGMSEVPVGRRKEERSCFVVLSSHSHEIKDEDEVFFIRVLHFQPPVTIDNLLCTDIEFQCMHMIHRAREDLNNEEYIIPGISKTAGRLSKGESAHWLDIKPQDSLNFSLKLPGYALSKPVLITSDSQINTHIYQFSSPTQEQVNIMLEVHRLSGVLRLIAYSQYWLENNTSLPIVFQYREGKLLYDPVVLSYKVDGLIIEDSESKPKWLTSSYQVATAQGSMPSLDRRLEKPWLLFKGEGRRGLSVLLGQDEHPPPASLLRPFSIGNMGNSQGSASVIIANSEWSPPFRITATSFKTSVISFNGQSIKAAEERHPGRPGCLYVIAMSLQLAEEPFSRTKIIKFAPRYIFVNKTAQVILVTQFEPVSDTYGVCRLLPYEKSNFHWPDEHRGEEICLKFEEPGWNWSGHFSIQEPDDFSLRLKNPQTHDEALVHITVTLEGCTLHVIVKDISTTPPYRIENYSMETLTIHQINAKEHYKILRPFEVCAYAWDEPKNKKILKVRLFGKSNARSLLLGNFKLDYPQRFEKINLAAHASHPAHSLFLEIVADGSTKVFTIRHDQSEEEHLRSLTLHKDSKEQFKLIVEVKRLGLSVVNSIPQELIYGQVRNFVCTLEKDHSDILIDVSFTGFQLDNQLYKAESPVMIRPLEGIGKQTVRFKLHKRQSTISQQEIEYYKHIKFTPCPVDINIDGQIIEYLLAFLAEAREVWTPNNPRQVEDQGKRLKSVQRYYFDKVQIGVAGLNLSFSSLPTMFKDFGNINPARMLFIMFSNIGNVSLDFTALKLSHRHLTVSLLRREILSFYINQCKNQMLSFLGSSDALGNPSEFLRHLRMGLIDLVTFSGQPNIGGFFSGVSSFLRHTIYGASNSTSRFFETLRKGIYSVYLEDGQERQGVVHKIVMAVAKTALLVPNMAVSIVSHTTSVTST